MEPHKESSAPPTNWMHKRFVTPDPTPEDRYWREQCERMFMIRAEPAERDRYYPGYWQACYAHWIARAPHGHFETPHTRLDLMKRALKEWLWYVWRRYFVDP